MALQSPESVRKLLASSRTLRERVLSIAGRLEALEEYHPDQALIVAADIVLNALKKGSASLTAATLVSPDHRPAL